MVRIDEIFSFKSLIVLLSCSQSVTKDWKQRTQAKSQRNTRLASSFCLCTGQFCGGAATLTLSFLFWLWPNQKEPLSNLKAVIKPTWTKQRSTELSWNFTTVSTHAEGYERLLLSCLTAETRLSLLDKFLTRTPWFLLTSQYLMWTEELSEEEYEFLD